MEAPFGFVVIRTTISLDVCKFEIKQQIQKSLYDLNRFQQFTTCVAQLVLERGAYRVSNIPMFTRLISHLHQATPRSRVRAPP